MHRSLLFLITHNNQLFHSADSEIPVSFQLYMIGSNLFIDVVKCLLITRFVNLRPINQLN